MRKTKYQITHNLANLRTLKILKPNENNLLVRYTYIHDGCLRARLQSLDLESVFLEKRRM